MVYNVLHFFKFRSFLFNLKITKYLMLINSLNHFSLVLKCK